MKRLTESIKINATSEDVWAALMDFDSYPEWNPFILEINGEPAEGSHLSVRMQAPGHKPMSFTPTVTRVEPGRGFSWLGKLWVKGLFDGHHHFDIEQGPNGEVVLTQSEDFAGLLAPLLMRTIGHETREGFAQMNAALKERIERR